MSEYMSLIYASDLWVNERSRVVDAACCMISHACDAVAPPVAFLTSRNAGRVKQSWRL